MDANDGYPDTGTIAKVLHSAFQELTRRTGRGFELTFSTEDRILRAVRDDGYHSAIMIRPHEPLAPSRLFDPPLGEQVHPAQAAKAAFRLRIDDAVDAIERGHDMQQAVARSKAHALALPQVGSSHG